MMHISSTANTRVKQVANLVAKARLRKELGLFVVEGIREVSRALSCGYQPVEFWVNAEENHYPELKPFAEKVILCTPAVYQKLAYRESTEVVLGVFKMQELSLSDLKPAHTSVFLIVEHIEKPGNLGAMMRTANGLGADALFICNPATDVYNPNVIRNSLGAFFDLPVIVATVQQVLDFCNSNEIALFATHLHASTDYRLVSYPPKTAILLGTESTGLSDFWLNKTTANIIIPMHGVVDSLNVSVAAAIVLAEVMRQRQVK